MGLTSDEQIAFHLKEMCDRQYYDAAHRDTSYAFGDKSKGEWYKGASPGEHPDYPKTFITQIRAGRSKRLMNAAAVHLSKICSGSVEPIFTQVDPWQGEVRKQFWKKRTRGSFFGLEQVNEANAGMFLDADQLGVGFIQWLWKKSPRTGFHYTHGRHSAMIRTLWDIHASHPGEARHWAPVIYIPAEEARKRWGSRAEDYIQKYFDEGRESGFEALKVYWYENIGDEYGGLPTYSVIPKSFEEKPLEKGDNPSGRLNMSYEVNFLLPGMRRPVGRVAMGMATNEILNIMEDRMLRTLRRGTIDVVSVPDVNEADWNKAVRGETDVVRSTSQEPKNAAMRIPGAEIGQGFPVIRDWYEKQVRSDLGTDEYDAGTAPEGVETLGEGQMIKAGTSVVNAWGRLQYLSAQLRSVDILLNNAGIGDRDPIDIDVFGYNIAINRPENPSSWINEFTQEPSEIFIDPTSLDTTARDQKRQARIAYLERLKGNPLVNPVWWTQEMVKACADLQDPKEAMIPGLNEGSGGGGQGLVTPGLVMGQEGGEAPQTNSPAPAGA